MIEEHIEKLQSRLDAQFVTVEKAFEDVTPSSDEDLKTISAAIDRYSWIAHALRMAQDVQRSAQGVANAKNESAFVQLNADKYHELVAETYADIVAKAGEKGAD
jgi:hypothetical protein